MFPTSSLLLRVAKRQTYLSYFFWEEWLPRDISAQLLLILDLEPTLAKALAVALEKTVGCTVKPNVYWSSHLSADTELTEFYFAGHVMTGPLPLSKRVKY